MRSDSAIAIPAYLAGACSALLLLMALGVDNLWYSQGVADCKAGKENYVITTTPEGVDTAYVHP